jgi:PleD family two-component response regulator
MAVRFGWRANWGREVDSISHYQCCLDENQKASQAQDSMTILLADDNLPSRELMREILEASGHAIIEAVNGRDA